jgi:23S rRNA G2445 N2-methylase RlmL
MTAIEWLVEQFEQVHTQRKWKEIIEQAKEMEKQQIIDAYVNGDIDAGIYAATKKNAEQYYNETFNLSQQDKP